MRKYFLMLTCHIIFLGSDLHLGFVNILDYSCAVGQKQQMEVACASAPEHNITSLTRYSHSYLKSPAANLASAKEKAASLITSPILVLV